MTLSPRKRGIEDEVLASKATVIGSTIVEELSRQSVDFWRDLAKRRDRAISDEVLLNLQTEDMIFAIHALDRLVFIDLGEQKRNLFIDALYQQVRNNLRSKYPTSFTSVGFSDWLDDTYNNRQIEYSPLTLEPPAKDQGFAGNLFWEYAKRALLASGITNPVMMIMVSMYAFDIFKSMQSLLEGIVYE